MAETTLVTGASGFIGTRLIRHMQATGLDAVGWTRAMGDLRDETSVQAALADLKPMRIFHLAASTPNQAGASWQQIVDEQRMLSNLAYAMPGHCRLIYTGSMAEYGRSGTFDELDPCFPDTPYGGAKFACTALALALRANLQLDIHVARLFGVYGGGEKDSRLLPALVRRLAQGAAVPLSDGRQVRDFVHVEDVSHALIALAEARDRPAIVNIGTGVGVTVREVCEAVASAMSADLGLLQFGAIARRSVDQDCLVARTDRLRTIITPPAQRWRDPALVAACVNEFLSCKGNAAPNGASQASA